MPERAAKVASCVAQAVQDKMAYPGGAKKKPEVSARYRRVSERPG